MNTQILTQKNLKTDLLPIDPIKARASLWFKGRLNFKLRPYQKPLEELFLTIRAKLGFLLVVICSRRWGKTYWLIKKSIEYARDPEIKRARIKYATAFLSDLEEIVIPLFDLILEDCPQKLRPLWRPSKAKYIFPRKVIKKVNGKDVESWTYLGGAQIKLVGLDKNPNGIRGGYADFIAIEEAQNVSRLKYLYSSVLMPMTMKRKKAMIVMIGTPPEEPAHEFVEFVEKARKEEAYLERDIYTNSSITPQEIERYKSECLTEADWLREYMCKFVRDEARVVIPEFDEEKNVKIVERDENFQYYHKYEIMDLGVKRDKTVCLFGYRDFKRAKNVITHEVVMTGPSMTTPKLAAAILATEKEAFGPEPYKVYVRKGDSDNPLLLQDLTAIYHLPFSATEKESLHAMVNQLRTNIQDYEFHPRCKETIGCIRAGIWNKTREKFDHSDVYGHYDGLAGTVYFEKNVDKLTNPIPNKWNPNAIRPYKPTLSPAAQGLARLKR